MISDQFRLYNVHQQANYYFLPLVKIQYLCCSIDALPTDLLHWRQRSASSIIVNESFLLSALLSWD